MAARQCAGTIFARCNLCAVENLGFGADGLHELGHFSAGGDVVQHAPTAGLVDLALQCFEDCGGLGLGSGQNLFGECTDCGLFGAVAGASFYALTVSFEC